MLDCPCMVNAAVLFFSVAVLHYFHTTHISIHFGNQLSQDLKDCIQYDTYDGFCAYHSMTQQEQTALRNRFAAKRYRKAKKLARMILLDLVLFGAAVYS